MRIPFIMAFLLASMMAQAQLKVVKLNKAAIPKSLSYKGHVIDAAKYTDSDGDHIVFTSETGITNSKGSDNEGLREAALYAFDYKIIDDKYILNWKLMDLVEPCELDVAARYLPGTFSITDVNKNGVAEIWLMYKTTCTGGVSPANLKIIMHEGTKKYAMRGETMLTAPDAKPEGGKYTFDAPFKAAPAIFRFYAVNLWNKNKLEKWMQ